jgi:competence protein CoiA
MLTAKRHSLEPPVLARDAHKDNAPFTCPSCGKEVVLHKGNIKIHHFQHKPPVICQRGEGESQIHLQIKLAIYDALRTEPNVTELEIEKDFGIATADVFARINGIPVAIEVQKSRLSVDVITQRTANYHKLNIAVLWIALPNPDLRTDKYSPSAWEKWVHAANYGRVYYWQSGQKLSAVHFGEHKLYVESTSWFESGGNQRSAGGYYKSSKRYRKPLHGQDVEISKAFAVSLRPTQYAQGTIIVPPCRLFLDRGPKWW